MEIYCGVDLGGTKIHIGLIKKDGSIISEKTIPTHVQNGAENGIKNIIETILELLKVSKISIDDLKGIGIGSPGPLDSEKGVILESCNLHGWQNVPITSKIREIFPNIPVVLENDANAATLGEYLFGMGKNSKNFVYITVSTGIGGGAVMNGKLYKGSNSNAFEIGHTIISLNGRVCNCGNDGCWEAYASGTSLAKIASEKISQNNKSLIKEIAEKEGKKIDAKHVFEACRQKDELAVKLVKNQGYYLGVGLFNIIASYNPEKIAIGGGVSKAFDLYKKDIFATLEKMSLKASREICEIGVCKEKNCGMLGAAALCF